MKRSDMVSLIKLYIEEHQGNGAASHLNEDEFADYLLMKIEEQGMSPPFCTVFEYDGDEYTEIYSATWE